MILLQLISIILFNELTSAQRPIRPNDFRSQFIEAHLTEFWKNQTDSLESYILHHFNTFVINHANVFNDSSNDQGLAINPKCLEIIDYMLRSPLDEEWILKSIDSGFRLPSGILSGTTTSLGDFDQCISIQNEIFKNESFHGRYCFATLSIPRTELFRNSMPIDSERFGNQSWLIDSIQRWYHNDNFYSTAIALCFPTICEPNDILQLLQSNSKFLAQFEFNVTYCQSSNDVREYDSGLIVAIIILCLPWLLIVPATLIEKFSNIHQRSISSRPLQYLLCFSLIKNNRFLFQIKKASGADRQEFQFIHGIRALGSIFIMCAHAGALVFVPMFMPISILARHPTDSIAISKTLLAQPFYNGALIVMTFFVISGFLGSYLHASKQKLSLSFVSHLLLRWARFTPALVGTICLNIVLQIFGNGPLFHRDILWPTLRPCYRNWWIHLLYISNFFGFEEMCNIQTWYISADLQVHLISYLILVLWFRKNRWAIIGCISLILIGMIGIVIPIAFDWIQLVLIQTIVYTKFPYVKSR
ncbi:osmotic avoidance abnormal protein 3 [Sarcoptes scabiei]|uniref:Acyltransferase-like protein 2 n=1 Tax=Sarcoptes scabiei TaxID=52283 RepID=A0A131ZXT1_SARSC|nr:Acyltransferase-like protein 2 [Sarcoptes scabiei]UXI17926.1 osmotic avoidance abnormal protein 3 [Sarcoptes scabiei]